MFCLLFACFTLYIIPLGILFANSFETVCIFMKLAFKNVPQNRDLSVSDMSETAIELF